MGERVCGRVLVCVCGGGVGVEVHARMHATLLIAEQELLKLESSNPQGLTDRQVVVQMGISFECAVDSCVGWSSLSSRAVGRVSHHQSQRRCTTTSFARPTGSGESERACVMGDLRGGVHGQGSTPEHENTHTV